MASRRPRPRRFLLPTILAAVLATEITGLAIARSLAPASAPAAAPPGPIAAAPAARAKSPGTAAFVADASRDAAVPRTAAGRFAAEDVVARPPAAAPASVARATHAAPASHVRPSTRSHAAAPAYHGRNHVWIPSLGINRSVQSFPCSRSRPPDGGVYRWGCAGTNNVYLLSHAWSTFRPLHDAYLRGRLHAGMKVIYADGTARVHTYRVAWWRVVAPTTAASWAWASLSRPGMTLQTCVGSNSQYRLMVRLVRVA